MTEGIEHLGHMGEPIEPISFGVEVSNSIRSMAALEGLRPEEVVWRALNYYDEQLRLEREGWEGPLYRRDLPTGKGRLFDLFFGGEEIIKIDLKSDTPPAVE